MIRPLEWCKEEMAINWDAASTVANIVIALVAVSGIYISLRMVRREREYQRLREKLLFYSDLIAGFESSHTDKKYFFTYLQQNVDIQKKYPALAERDLYVYLEHIIPAARSHEEGSFDKVQDMVKEAMLIILKDFDHLKEEYKKF